LRKKLREADAELQRLLSQRDSTAQDKKKKESTPRVVLEGTAQRPNQLKPVYLVCSGRDAILQPQGRSFAANPDKADQQAFLTAAHTAGYVVFLIRPDGIPCFKVYRYLLTSDNTTSGYHVQFGYEPVNADWDCSNPG
jgi:hypothetical protein